MFMENSKAGRANLYVGLYLVGVYSVYVLAVTFACIRLPQSCRRENMFFLLQK